MSDETEPQIFKCPKFGCEYETEDEFRLFGHFGGAHARKREKPIPHGTTNGYRMELKRKGRTGKDPCQRCRAAWARYVSAVRYRRAIRQGIEPALVRKIRLMRERGTARAPKRGETG